MAMLHNSIIRGFNSIWLQAPHVKPEDKADFVGYARTWHKFVESHHYDEEANLFPKVAEVLHDKDVWAESHREHGTVMPPSPTHYCIDRTPMLTEKPKESFLEGLGNFDTYLNTLNTTDSFSGEKLRTIMDSFREPFETHFHNEIKTIAAMADHHDAPKQGTAAEDEAGLVFKTWGKATVSKAGRLDVVPFFLLNLDRTVEDGLWANWPPMPAPIKVCLARDLTMVGAR